MFGGVGFSELLIIAAVGLVVLGPEKFPEFAKIAARFVKDFRGYMSDIQREVGKEIKPIQTELAKLRKIDPEKYIDSLTRDDKENKDDVKEAEEAGTPNPEPEYGIDGTFRYDSHGSRPAEPEAAPADSTPPVSPAESVEDRATEPADRA